MDINYKKEHKFDFARCMKFFLVNINGCIERNDIEINPLKTVTYTVTCYSYPYDYDVIRLIENTFKQRNIGVRMKSYKLGTDEKKRRTYVYDFLIGMLNAKEN